MAAPDCAECIKARPGQRVVRGPDWWGGSEDGGSDHVGTIISVYQPGTDSGYSTHPVEVHWDAGPLGYYRAGCSYGTCDLRLIDAGPAGVVFSNISCGNCGTDGLVGTWWKCANCADYNLCHSCYMGDKHNIEHEFFRYDDPASVGRRVQPRKESRKVPFHGIYPGAEVQSQDGVKNGIVGNVRGKALLLRKTAGGKLFYNNTDKVDDSWKLQKAACGGYYYRDHMPVIALPGHDRRDIQLFSSNPRMMSAGACVSVVHDSGPFERFQLRAAVWSSHLKDRNLHTFQCCGKEGHVLEFINQQCLKVRINNTEGVLDSQCVVQVRTTSHHTMSLPGRDIGSGGKGLGYAMCMPALHAACRLGDDDAVTMLLTAGADLEEADNNGDTAAHHASASEPSAQEPSVQRRAGNDTAAAEGAPASSTESICAPVPSDEEANCRSAKKEPKEEEIDDRHACAICMEKERTVAFLCGHGTCQECATKIQHCHVCRAPIKKIIMLYEG